MFDFIAFAYVILYPVSVLMAFFTQNETRAKAIRFRALINLSMIVYGFYVVKQVVGLYQMARMLGIPPLIQHAPAFYMIKLAFLVILPLLFLWKNWMLNPMIGTFVWLVAVMLKTYRISNVDQQPIWLLFSFYSVLLLSIYGLLRIIKKLPQTSQS